MRYSSTAKYHSKKTAIDGITFDSKAEAKRYAELKLMEKAGKITGLVLQPMYELQPAFRKNGRAYRRIAYVADFAYTDAEGNRIVEDVKGMGTPVYLLKRKMFEYQYPHLTITEVKK